MSLRHSKTTLQGHGSDLAVRVPKNGGFSVRLTIREFLARVRRRQGQPEADRRRIGRISPNLYPIYLCSIATLIEATGEQTDNDEDPLGKSP